MWNRIKLKLGDNRGPKRPTTGDTGRARCGRCGLWNEYPENHHEKKYAGLCMWYQTRLDASEVFEPRRCVDFFERIPGLHPFDHFKYKIQRDNLGDAYEAAKRAKRLAYVGLGLSVAGLLAKFL
tara:strand:+ start:1211 stop:1582 length:372 start_codon:yes stop_codon:yes gene_type:complete